MKYILIALLILGLSFGMYSYLAQASDSGALSPGTMADDATVGTVAWSNPNNAKVSDNVYAVAGTAGGTTHYLKATNFGFTIPSGATIDGIVVEFEWKKSGGSVTENAIRIVKSDGTIGTTNKSSGLSLPTTEAYKSFGSSSDLWGETWDDTKINDVDFGTVVALQLEAGGASFHRDTLISTESGYRRISDVVVGDKVKTFNEKTGIIESNIVTEVTNKVSESGYRYIYTDSGKLIKATPNHIFFVNGQWLSVKELKVGDILFNEDLQSEKITQLEDVKIDEDVWDLEVESNHNFFANGILVHNLQGIASIDHIRITVYYTEGSAPAAQTRVSPVIIFE